MKILKNWLYHSRMIYLIEVEDNKVHLFYKSTGINDSDSKDIILPCFLLKTQSTQNIVDIHNEFTLGWISKCIILNKVIHRYFSKKEEIFPEKLKEISLFISNEKVNVNRQEDPDQINLEILEILQTFKLYSFYMENTFQFESLHTRVED